mmetsp:Transcript_29910/g.83606  ORF Transcript_29910/g.83606 Transcript_29910/m.83606 type:complete len:393 (-) Transcript_29910:56-1234(-)|eukprot:CAMPEP_0119118630 /NCGR_PEP_ID=MMETSP1310-20130426/443_1 /TAXON_ID=464262 /ORGANISM="Genus nov. species nov., Strain RCC2339" /LENGTH=392 /DNA_ID=CAMNT_0007108017 /DNA_START=148 /DNA_END=1326 /DNA_ORIENTATION=+
MMNESGVSNFSDMDSEDYFNSQSGLSKQQAENGKCFGILTKLLVVILVIAIVFLVTAFLLFIIDDPEENSSGGGSNGGGSDNDFMAVLTVYSLPNVANGVWREIRSSFDATAVDGVLSAGNQYEAFVINERICFVDDTGSHTNDALIMTSKSDCGGVGAMPQLDDTSASMVARSVMEDTEHSLIVGQEAVRFAELAGHSSRPFLNTSTCRSEYNSWQTSGCQPNFWSDPSVNCMNRRSDAEPKEFVPDSKFEGFSNIVLDRNGLLACISYSPGSQYRISGRVGLAGVPGGGCFANQWGAAVAVGDGDLLARTMPAMTAAQYLAFGKSPQTAAFQTIDHIRKLQPDAHVAVFVMNTKGQVGAAHCSHNPHDEIAYLYQNTFTTNATYDQTVPR